MWTVNRFPSAMRSLNPSTRAKAIEIANQLLSSGYTNKQEVIAVSIDQARSWMRRVSVDSSLSGSMFATTV